MKHTALYRKFRPDNFDDVKGQDHIVKTLRNQILYNRLGHAYLFCGTRGTGKTTMAKILAKAINCENPAPDGSPCNHCQMCETIQNGNSLNVIEIDAASNNGVDNIRELKDEINYRPSKGHYKVYIIDEVHMLSTGAFNALLKTLEEPPEYVLFILATTEAHKIPITILSRCQRYNFRRITINDITSRLFELLQHEHINAEEKAIKYIAKIADGSMRDALSILDQCIAFFYNQTLTYENVLKILGAVDSKIYSQLLRKIIAGDVKNSLKLFEKLLIEGKEISRFVNDFIWYMRNLLLLKTSEGPEELIDVSKEELICLKEESKMIENETLLRYIRVLSELSNPLKLASQKRVTVETAIIKLCRPEMETNMDSILDRIRVLESKIAQGSMLIQQPASIQQSTMQQTPVKTVDKPEKPPIKEAVPDDLLEIVNNWEFIIKQASHPLSDFLKNAIPKYNPDNCNSTLFVEFQSFLGTKYENDHESEKEIEDIIQKKTGKKVHIKFVIIQNKKSDFFKLRELRIEQALKNIHMDITIEDNDTYNCSITH